MTINELAEKIIRLTGSSAKIVHAEERAGDVKHSQASIARAKAAGFVPAGSFEQGLAETIGSFKQLNSR